MINLLPILQIRVPAYLDPAATSGIVTAVSGIVIAGSSLFVVFWRNAKESVFKLLGIDVNRNKEVEEDIVKTDRKTPIIEE